jgi:hypothetical protein
VIAFAYAMYHILCMHFVSTGAGASQEHEGLRAGPNGLQVSKRENKVATFAGSFSSDDEPSDSLLSSAQR